MQCNKKNKWYSVIIALFMVWFLIVVTSWIFNLVLREMKDNRWMWDYLRAYAWAEWAQEMALLEIKKNGYWYYDKIEHNKSNRSIVLSQHPLSIPLFREKRDVFISYDIQSRSNSFSWVVDKLGYSIIPLFYIDKLWIHSSKKIWLNITSGVDNDLVWNIIWSKSWISWTWTFIQTTLWAEKKVLINELSFSKTTIEDFLSLEENNTSYLILFNSNNTSYIEFNLSWVNITNLFTKPESLIISSAEVWWYKQTLKTTLNNTEYLNILRYSIFSN